jgi:transcriptional regulator with XRE-family HTH domain
MTSTPSVFRNGARASAADLAIGQKLRERRRAAGLSLHALAARTGCSIGYISQVERGLSTASIKFLTAAADAFGMGLAGFFVTEAEAEAEPKPGDDIVVRRGERGRLGLWRAGIAKELLTPPQGASALNLFMVRIEPFGSSGEEDYRHGGEEAGFVLEGELRLMVDGREFQLEAGDSFRFESRRPHRFANPTDRPAVVLWVNAATA